MTVTTLPALDQPTYPSPLEQTLAARAVSYSPHIYIDASTMKATTYAPPYGTPHVSNQSTIVIRMRDERMARYIADLINIGKLDEAQFRLIAQLYR